MARVRSTVASKIMFRKLWSTLQCHWSRVATTTGCCRICRLDDASDEEDVGASRETKEFAGGSDLRTRSALYCFIMSARRGVIALPDLQRPFVWEDTKVATSGLSVRWIPVGTLVFCILPTRKIARALGAESPGLRATTLVIDGQQRLTVAIRRDGRVSSFGKDGAMRRS